MSPTPQDSSSHKPSHLKRGGSSDLDQDPPKRARKDSASQEEKKRGRRLFGGLLGTLGQNDAGSQQRKRHGIEKRSQDRIAKQIEEEDRRREDGLARITEVRRAEQVVFLEKVVRLKSCEMEYWLMRVGADQVCQEHAAGAVLAHHG